MRLVFDAPEDQGKLTELAREIVENIPKYCLIPGSSFECITYNQTTGVFKFRDIEKDTEWVVTRDGIVENIPAYINDVFSWAGFHVGYICILDAGNWDAKMVTEPVTIAVVAKAVVAAMDGDQPVPEHHYVSEDRVGELYERLEQARTANATDMTKAYLHWSAISDIVPETKKVVLGKSWKLQTSDYCGIPASILHPVLVLVDN